jgi:iron complex outermembrane recepter protein
LFSSSLSPQPNLSKAPATEANGCIASTDAATKAFNYLDLTASVELADKMTFRVGVNHVLDKNPTIIGSTHLMPGVAGNGNTFPQI